MHKSIAALIIDQILFFDLSDDDAVDPDVACGQLEWIFATLRELPPGELDAFRTYVLEEAAARKRKKRPKREIEVVRSICDDLEDLG